MDGWEKVSGLRKRLLPTDGPDPTGSKEPGKTPGQHLLVSHVLGLIALEFGAENGVAGLLQVLRTIP